MNTRIASTLLCIVFASMAFCEPHAVFATSEAKAKLAKESGLADPFEKVEVVIKAKYSWALLAGVRVYFSNDLLDPDLLKQSIEANRMLAKTAASGRVGTAGAEPTMLQLLQESFESSSQPYRVADETRFAVSVHERIRVTNGTKEVEIDFLNLPGKDTWKDVASSPLRLLPEPVRRAGGRRLESVAEPQLTNITFAAYGVPTEDRLGLFALAAGHLRKSYEEFRASKAEAVEALGKSRKVPGFVDGKKLQELDPATAMLLLDQLKLNAARFGFGGEAAAEAFFAEARLTGRPRLGVVLLVARPGANPSGIPEWLGNGLAL
jgi:hypothetical protein